MVLTDYRVALQYDRVHRVAASKISKSRGSRSATSMQWFVRAFLDLDHRVPNAEAIKFTKFRSNRIPAPAGVQMWHIDMVDRADFFGFSSDRCLEMPGLDFVPDYTTVRFVNRSIDLEKLEHEPLESTFPSSLHLAS